MFNPDEYIQKVMAIKNGEQLIEGKMGPMDFYERIELLCAYIRQQLTKTDRYIEEDYIEQKLADDALDRPAKYRRHPLDWFPPDQSDHEDVEILTNLEYRIQDITNQNYELFTIKNVLHHTFFNMYLQQHTFESEYNKNKRTRLHFQFVTRKIYPYKNGKGHLVAFRIRHAVISDITADENGRLINRGRRWKEEFKMLLNNTENGVRVMYILPKNKIAWGYQEDNRFFRDVIGSWIKEECSDAVREMMSVSSFIPMAKYYKLDKFDTTRTFNESFDAAKFITDRKDLSTTFSLQENSAFAFAMNTNVLAVLGKHKGTKGVLNYQYDKTGVKFLPKDAFGGMNTLVDLVELYEAAVLTRLFRFYDTHVFSRYSEEMRALVNLNKWDIKRVNVRYGDYGASANHRHTKRQYSYMEYIMKFFGYSERILKIALSAWNRVDVYAQDEEGRQYENGYVPATFLMDTVNALKSIKSRTVRNAIREHFRNHNEMNDIKLIHDYVSAEAQKIASANVDLTKGKYYERFNGHKIEFIKKDGSKDHVTMVCAPDTHELIKWGTSYNICTGLDHYRNAAKKDEAILVAFERSGNLDYDHKYIGFAEITPNTHYIYNPTEKDFDCDGSEMERRFGEFVLNQLLGHSNRVLPDIERDAIKEFLKNELNVVIENGYW